jgi:hypothetical protein
MRIVATVLVSGVAACSALTNLDPLVGDAGGGDAGFPSTAILDDFNRPDENPLTKNGAWGGAVLPPGDAGPLPLAVKNGVAVAANGQPDGTQVWGTAFAADQEAFATISTTSGNRLDLFTRVDNPGQDSLTGYAAFFYGVAGDGGAGGEIDAYRIDSSSTYTLMGVHKNVPTTSPGDRIGVAAVGNTVSYFVNGVFVASDTDYNHPDGGFIGAGTHGYGAFDDFGGGNVP